MVCFVFKVRLEEKILSHVIVLLKPLTSTKLSSNLNKYSIYYSANECFLLDNLPNNPFQ